LAASVGDDGEDGFRMSIANRVGLAATCVLALACGNSGVTRSGAGGGGTTSSVGGSEAGGGDVMTGGGTTDNVALLVSGVPQEPVTTNL